MTSSYKTVEPAARAATDRVLTRKSSRADLEDIDLLETIVELQMQQLAYQAALGATEKIITTSLADFLR